MDVNKKKKVQEQLQEDLQRANEEKAEKNPKVDISHKEIEMLTQENVLLENQLKKALADYANLERDIDKRVGMIMLQNKLKIVKALLKTVDDVNFAFKSAENISFNEETQSWFNGIKIVLEDIDKAFEELGIEKINVVKGDVFDSSIHEAISSIPTTDANQEGKVFDVIQAGFKIGDAVIRPARVVISKSK
ncbi:MAG TPA: nucleotide exchange factor GrpE [Candidatus Dojkabacteria bacterium]|nr:nucleotide exchange factor GrpE [Candidatus Dojkabacteria bacterium]